MSQVIDLEGLPPAVAEAITETVQNLKNSYRFTGRHDSAGESRRDLPSHPGTVIGNLRRTDIYDER